MTVNIASSILLRGLQSKLEQNKFTIMQDTTEKCGKVHGVVGFLGHMGTQRGAATNVKQATVTVVAVAFAGVLLSLHCHCTVAEATFSSSPPRSS